MTATQNPAASGHLPYFITPPGETDVILHVVGWFVLLCVIGLGVIFFTIHSLPERMAHRTKKVQLDIVAVLCLLALLTNEHVFWFAALILAFIDLPDFLSPVLRIATAIENIAGKNPAESSGVAGVSTAEAAALGTEVEHSAKEPASKESGLPEATRQKGATHA
jgi:hypothetical protein